MSYYLPDIDSEAYDEACSRFHTDEPTPAQYWEVYQELLEKVYDHTENYHNQDGDN